MIYQIIKKKIEGKDKFSIRIVNNKNGLSFGYVGGYKGYNFRDTYEECYSDLERLKLENKIEEEKKKEEVVYTEEVDY